MNLHTRSGINGQDGEAAFIIIHVGNLNSKSLTLQITVLSQNPAKDKGGHLQSCTKLWFWWSSWKPSSTVEVLEAYCACCRMWQNFMSVQDKMELNMCQSCSIFHLNKYMFYNKRKDCLVTTDFLPFQKFN